MKIRQILRRLLRVKQFALLYYYTKKTAGKISEQTDIDFDAHYCRIIPEIDKSPSLKRKLYHDAIACYYRYGCSMNQYWYHGFYRLSPYGRSEYITAHISTAIDTYCNAIDVCKLLSNKIETYRLFSQIYGREVFFKTGDPLADKQRFFDFCRCCSKIIIKPVEGSSGEGIKLLDVSEPEKIEVSWAMAAKDGYIIEQALTQHALMAALYPDAVNTIRINTLMVKGIPQIVSAFIRTGRDHMVIDNAHAGGLFAPVDVSTGIVTYMARNHVGDQFLCHPDTNIVFPGFQIPSWAAVKKIVCDAAFKLPEGKHIGWDMAIREDATPVLIECNTGSGVDAQQLSIRRGLLKEYETLLAKKFEPEKHYK